MAIKEFDVFVIGTGTAGKTVAFAAANAEKSVAIADDREYGGTCANRGCDPKKVIVGITALLNGAQNLQDNGVSKTPKLSWKEMMAFKKTFTDPVPYVHENNLKKQGIVLYHQSPRFIDKNTLSVEGKTVKAKKIVIATGEKQSELKIPGGDYALTSDDFLELEQLPESMLFIGGGYIGMELSHIAARMGVKVTVIHAHERPLNRFDKDMVNELTKVSKKLGIKFIFNARVNEIEKGKDGFYVLADRNKDKVKEKAEMVFNAAGRSASINKLNLNKGGVSFTKGGITVNDKLQNPDNKNVFACGDVADSPGLSLSPLSSFEAKIVVSQLFDKNPKTISYPTQPSVVFTLPNLAMVGLTEEEAKKKGIDVAVKKGDAGKWYNAKRTKAKAYAYKTIIEKESGRIIGAHIIGPQAAEMINLFAMAMNNKIKSKDLKKMIFAYPTWGSDIQSMI